MSSLSLLSRFGVAVVQINPFIGPRISRPITANVRSCAQQHFADRYSPFHRFNVCFWQCPCVFSATTRRALCIKTDLLVESKCK